MGLPAQFLGSTGTETWLDHYGNSHTEFVIFSSKSMQKVAVGPWLLTLLSFSLHSNQKKCTFDGVRRTEKSHLHRESSSLINLYHSPGIYVSCHKAIINPTCDCFYLLYKVNNHSDTLLSCYLAACAHIPHTQLDFMHMFIIMSKTIRKTKIFSAG